MVYICNLCCYLKHYNLKGGCKIKKFTRERMTLNSLRKYITILLSLSLLALSACGGDKQDVRYRNQRLAPAPYYQQNPYYYQNPPTVQPGYGGGYQYPPASRYYQNPYAFPPQNQYPYYDSDQYYVPPSSYGTTDIDNPDGGFEKF